MGDFEAKLDRILSDPGAMQQIMSLAQSLGGTSQTPPGDNHAAAPPPGQTPVGLDAQLLGSLSAVMQQCNQGEDARTALLEALRPFVKPQRYARLDKALQIAKLSRVIRTAFTVLRAREDSHV